MRYALFLGALLCAGCVIESAPAVPGPATDDAGTLPATGGPGGSGTPRSAGSYGLRLRLPFPEYERRTFTRGYYTPGVETTHMDYDRPHMDDRFAIDLAGEGCASWRAPVLAAASGVVFFNGDHGYGNNVFLDHENGCETHYAHLDEIAVADGQWVHQGQLLGYEGNSGSVSGSACPAHPGTHVHFVAMCHGEAVLPEPISGYWGLRGREGAELVSDNAGFARHPPGTLVKAREGPRVFLVDDEGRLRWLRTEDDLRSRRLYRDSGDPFGLVVTVTESELVCYPVGEPLEWPVTMRVTRCGDGGHYLAIDDRGDRRRFWIPGAPGGALFRALIASWGFRESEVVEAHAGCGYPLADASLYLRDGTVVQDGASYAYIAHGSRRYAVRPEMLWAMGYAADDVLAVPAGSLDALTRGPDPSRPSLSWDELSGCGGTLPPPRMPTGESDVFGGFGGALPASPGMDSPSPADAGLEGPPADPPDAGTPPPMDPPPAVDAGTPPGPPPSCGHFVQLRFSGVAGPWSFGYGFGTAHPAYEAVSGAIARDWDCVSDGWLLTNGAFPDGSYLCGEWPAGTFSTPYGLPEVFVDGRVVTVERWHNPGIPGGVGCDLRACVGTCR